jgi:hypothetical protein
VGQAQSVTFAPGRTVLRRYWRGGRITFLNVFRVVADDARGLLLWQPMGVPFWRLLTPDGRTRHDDLIGGVPDLTLSELPWQGVHLLVLMRPGAAHSVSWFFGPDLDFRRWYVNLEDPFRRWDDGAAAGVDTADHALDLLVAPDRSWQWKDEDEFAERTGHPDYWDTAQAAAVRAEGERVAAAAGAGAFPFDGTWTDFRPDPAWPVPGRPTGWDRPQVGREAG